MTFSSSFRGSVEAEIMFSKIPEDAEEGSSRNFSAMENGDQEDEIEPQERKDTIKKNKKHVNANEGDSFLTVLGVALIVILLLFDIILHTGHSKSASTCTCTELDLQPSDMTSTGGSWIAGQVDESCSQACSSAGLVCTEENLYLHNSFVDSPEELSGILSVVVPDISFSEGGCVQDQFSSGPTVPMFKQTGEICRVSAADRDLSTFSCDRKPAPANDDKRRLCYCNQESSITSLKKQASFQPQNLVMVKPGKVGGSTLSGVIRHIAAHHGLSNYDNEEWIKNEPGIFAKHSKMKTLYDNIKSLKQKTFLSTIIRDPSERCLSDFNFFKTRRTHRTETRDFGDKLKYFEKYCTNIMLEYIASQEEVLSMDESAIDEVVEMYDLIGLTERFNETMVLMKHLLGLQWRDVLYIPAKISGSSDRIQSYTSYKDETLELHEYVERKWKKINKDFYLHEKVELEFERKIAMIPSFEEDLIKYEMLLNTIQTLCSWMGNLVETKECDKAVEVFEKGYIKDAQIGFGCLNQVGDVDQFFDKIQLPD